jgi:hypothetical protein
MSYAKLNIWLRDLNCCPKNFWLVDLVVKTCGGDYLVDFNPDVIEKLKEAYPGYNVGRATRGNETVIRIMEQQRNEVIKHIEVEVPPGCYIVRVWVCYQNLWSDRVMVIVGCGKEACVNLLVPPKDNCIRDVIIPFGKAAHDMRLQPDKVRIATEMLMTTGLIQRETVLREVTDLNRELKESKVNEALKYVQALEFIEKVVKGIRIEKE